MDLLKTIADSSTQQLLLVPINWEKNNTLIDF